MIKMIKLEMLGKILEDKFNDLSSFNVFDAYHEDGCTLRDTFQESYELTMKAISCNKNIYYSWIPDSDFCFYIIAANENEAIEKVESF
jgi:hypothetical protein